MKNIIYGLVVATVYFFGEIITTDNGFAVGIKNNPNFNTFILSTEKSKTELGKNLDVAQVIYQMKKDFNFIILAKLNDQTIIFKKMR